MDKRMIKGAILGTTSIGAAAGYLILHPYAMIVYMLYEPEGGVIHDLAHTVAFSFKAQMLPMGVPFALLGGVVGMFLGLWLDARKKRAEAELQVEKLEKQVAQLRR